LFVNPGAVNFVVALWKLHVKLLLNKECVVVECVGLVKVEKIFFNSGQLLNQIVGIHSGIGTRNTKKLRRSRPAPKNNNSLKKFGNIKYFEIF